MEIKLVNGNSSARIISKGAELRSYVSGGRELMWQADPAYWGKTSPFLFPMIGNLRGGKTLINGVEYAITKHGFARDNEFTAKQISDSEAEFMFASNDVTRQSFPFDFEVTLRYKLLEDSMRTDYTVTNKGGAYMPFCIGAHPAFACPAEGEKFSDYKLIFERDENVISPVMNLETRMWGDSNRVERLRGSREFALRYSLFDNDCVYFDTIKSKSVSLVSCNTGKGVNVSWEGFETLGVWTPDHKEAPFVCIEPWCGCDDYDTDDGIFANKRGIQIAKPYGQMHYSMTIKEI